jgi:hypothetical protein
MIKTTLNDMSGFEPRGRVWGMGQQKSQGSGGGKKKGGGGGGNKRLGKRARDSSRS